MTETAFSVGRLKISRKGRKVVEQDKIRHALKTVLSLPEGRLAFWSIIDSADLLNYSDMPYESAEIQRQAGRKEMVAQLLQQLEEASPGIYAIMLQEANNY